MKAIHSHLVRTAGLVAGTLLAASVSFAASGAEADAFPEFENFIKFSAQGNSISGSKAAYQKTTQKESAGSLGIEEFSFAKDLNDTTSLKIDGRALGGAEDYLAAFKVTKNEVGSVDASFKTFRTFYDGAGGFFPLNNAWLSLYPRELYVDRAKFTVGATVALPNAPVFSLRYTNETRTGKKDSTIWGDTDQTGIPIYTASALNPISANRKIVPAYNALDEKHEELEFSVRHTFGNTTASLTFIGTRIDNDDRRSVDRYPGELKPYPALPTSGVVPVAPVMANNQNKGYDRQMTKEDGRSVVAKVETAINPKFKVFASGLIHHATDDIAAERMISGAIATKTVVQDAVGSFTSGGRPPYSYVSAGTIHTDTFTGVIGVETKLLPDLTLNAAVRAEQYDVSGFNNATYINYLVVPATGAISAVPFSAANGVRISEKPVSPEINVRYTGIKTVALYADWDYRSSPSDERTSYIGIAPSGNVIIASPGNENARVKEKHSNLKIGANWTACTFFNARAEFFTKDHENNFTGYGTSLGDFYRLDYDTSGARLSATVKPIAQLAFTTRFVEQIGKTKTIGDAYPSTDAGDSKLYQISESIDWTPNKAVYVQLNLNATFDTISTSYTQVNGTAKNVNHDANNNYRSGSFLTGLVVGKHTDLQLQGTYYKSDNYQPALAGSTQPYGMSAQNSSITAGVKHQLTDRIVANAKVGYVDSKNETAGGFSDFRGPVAYVALDYKL